MPEQTTGDLNVGCNFDATTAKAVHGKSIILALFAKDGRTLLAVAGQQGLSWSIEAENSETQTKDGTGDWAVRYAGVKSWSASTDGLWVPEDEGRKAIVTALKDGTPLCVGIYERTAIENGMKYVPIRKGLALVSSDELEAPSDDNATVSVEFEGTGECWCRETAQPSDVEKATISITNTLALMEG